MTLANWEIIIIMKNNILTEWEGGNGIVNSLTVLWEIIIRVIEML